MGLKDDLIASCAIVHATKWDVVAARVVPAPIDIGLGNAAKNLSQAVVLYADLDGSTAMVDTKYWWFSAEVYKNFLNAAAKIVKSEGGVITAYDGDRIMAIFFETNGGDAAVRAALRINWAVRNIINPAIKARYNTDFIARHTVGIDISDLHAVRTGVRGDNDLVWVGRAANYAAKLTTLSTESPTWITKAVHDKLSEGLLAKDGVPIWKKWEWTSMNQHPIRSSTWELPIS
ncbi:MULTISPECIES: adenylate/guanylate cyclase domain-containing protein [unclassified Xanthomonas]|uniref:adenylate/guanylate cyclase domain-containing protein n=1 Tax=unclassified Xanthomonas TaxID=2643310 RepID=UPI001639B6D7|nr:MULTISPECIES: adenylate/guanylate cyclase domain-containing protein [unclassified Xanthomonas]QNH12967.1 hypothetical protein HEP75_02409 [Xanthomonas sp. SI]QNH16923.1 hypothetical protein HEP74_02063 [Xanthomonas sp. SS]